MAAFLTTASRRFYATGGKLSEFLTNRPPTRVTTLSNGLKVATESGFGETASVGVYINAGSAYETPANNGVAHFLEHLIFKGTPKRSQHDLEVTVENIGASLNAYTTREHTAYFARVFKKDVATGVDILADILQNPLLDPRAIDLERSTILTEKETVEKQEEEVVFDHLHSAAFLDNPLGLTILGTDENIKSISRQQLVDYVQTHYSADRMVLVGTGAVDHDQLVSLADKAFASLPKTSRAPKRDAPTFFGALAKDEEDDKHLAYIAFGVKSVEWSHADHFTFMVLQALLGTWDRSMGANTSSRVCEKVAHHGLAHSVSHFNTCYHNTGIFGVYAVAPEEHLEHLCHTLLHAWPETASFVSENELRRAKNRVQAACLSLDGNTAVMEDIGRQILTLGRRMSAAEIYQRIESVSSCDIRRIAREYLVNTPLAGSALGRVNGLPDYNHLMAYAAPLL
jgi:processing peptidase subunit beta